MGIADLPGALWCDHFARRTEEDQKPASFLLFADQRKINGLDPARTLAERLERAARNHAHRKP